MNTQFSLSDWLNWIKSIHVTEMDLSLERVSAVASRLNLLKPLCPVITIGGTNGKGSCVAGLEAIYLAQGYKVGTFTTPFLIRHNEQVRIQGIDATDQDFCQAYQRIEVARGDITLTLFEFNALAAFEIFHKANLDVWLLEVGLGGRWDAVNVIDADVAVIASISIDHSEWLGDTREAIAIEKAGIFRTDKSAVCGDFSPPSSLIEAAKNKKTALFIQGEDFGFEEKQDSWDFWSPKGWFKKFPLTRLALQNMASVLMTIELLNDRLTVSRDAIDSGLAKVVLPGRVEVVPGKITQIFDVSHNPAAAEFLAEWLRDNAISGKTRAVFSMLVDKDIVSTLMVMKDEIDEWFVGPIESERGASLAMLNYGFQKAGILNIKSYQTIREAHEVAVAASQIGDRVVVFGSFRTVAAVKAID